MLEASDMNIIHMISPVLVAFMYRVSDEPKICPITTMFTDYVDIMRDVYKITKSDKWKEEEVENIAERIKIVKRNGVSIFGMYQTSGMCTVKRHVLDHICEDFKRNRFSLLCSADLFAYAHNIFKSEYQKTTNRWGT